MAYRQNIDIKELSSSLLARATLTRERIIEHFARGAQGQMSQSREACLWKKKAEIGWSDSD
jgi:hypothetical protein